MASEETTALPLAHFKYSNRVILNTIFGRPDRGVGLVGERVVIGGWVKSSREIKKEPEAAPESVIVAAQPKDVTCVEILQSRIPFFRSIMRVLGGNTHPVHQKLEAVIPKPVSTIAILRVSDGSCVASLQVLVDSLISAPGYLLPVGTCILAEGVLNKISEPGKYEIELKAEKILHIGTVDSENYRLSKKRLPLHTLRDCPQFRPRTTTVASVMRIRSALTFATHTFLQNHGFLCVQVPTLTITDSEGFSEKFQVTTLLGKEFRRDPKVIDIIKGVSLEAVKTAIEVKVSLIEELKRAESNKEAVSTAVKDLQKTNELASQFEAREKTKPETSPVTDKVEDFFSSQTYLAVSGRLHLGSYSCALGNVYSFGPRYRADKTESAKHAAEMWMAELEMAFSELEDAMNCADDYLKFLCNYILQNSSEDIKFLSKRIHNSNIVRLQSMATSSFQRILYAEAVNELKKVTDKKFESKIEWGDALTEDQVSYLADEIYKRPIMIYNYPRAVKPFYVRLNNDGETVAAFDVVIPKAGTLIRGSQNEERIDILSKRVKELGLPKEQYEWYLDLRRHGTVKHSGFSLAFDLVVLFATGLEDVREVIPFPRSHGRANN